MKPLEVHLAGRRIHNDGLAQTRSRRCRTDLGHGGFAMSGDHPQARTRNDSLSDPNKIESFDESVAADLLRQASVGPGKNRDKQMLRTAGLAQDDNLGVFMLELE